MEVKEEGIKSDLRVWSVFSDSIPFWKNSRVDEVASRPIRSTSVPVLRQYHRQFISPRIDSLSIEQIDVGILSPGSGACRI